MRRLYNGTKAIYKLMVKRSATESLNTQRRVRPVANLILPTDEAINMWKQLNLKNFNEQGLPYSQMIKF